MAGVTHLPDPLPTSWTDLNPREELTIFSTPLVVCYGALAVIVFGTISCVVARICRKEEDDDGFVGAGDVGYRAAISNSMFKESVESTKLPCLNCRLIEMGEMACYQDRCPQCGEYPPGRRQESIKRSRWSIKRYRSRYQDSKV